MRKRLWLASPVLAFALLASTASAEEIALPTEQATFTQTPELVPVKFGTHTVEFIKEDDRSFSATATQTASTWAQVSDAVFKAIKNYEPQLQIKISMKDVTSEELTNALHDGLGKSEYTYGIGIDAAMSVSSASILTFEFTYPVSIEKEQAITQYVKDTAAKIFSDNMTDFQKVRAAYEYIITNTNYSIAPEEDGGGHSIYSIAKDGIGVCQAYALLFHRLMEEEGIASKYIVGTSLQGINHAWNVVTIDGKTYHIDATYGDPVFMQQYVTYDAAGNGIVDQSKPQKEITMPQYVSYNTFLMSESQLGTNAGHTITEKRAYTKPSATNFAAWHNVTNAVTLDGKHYYYQNTSKESSGNLEMADFSKPTLTPKTFEIDGYINRAEHLTVFNDRILFSNIYGQLSEITKDGQINTILEDNMVGYIAVENNTLKVYELDAKFNADRTAYEYVNFYATKSLIYEEKANSNLNYS
ncbi:MAG: transglutaminase domain-containing protein [Caryophanon sp.]|nr:transglutaminase domain-containing protein [Caryophanon sp.]